MHILYIYAKYIWHKSYRLVLWLLFSPAACYRHYRTHFLHIFLTRIHTHTHLEPTACSLNSSCVPTILVRTGRVCPPFWFPPPCLKSACHCGSLRDKPPSIVSHKNTHTPTYTDTCIICLLIIVFRVGPRVMKWFLHIKVNISCLHCE